MKTHFQRWRSNDLRAINRVFDSAIAFRLDRAPFRGMRFEHTAEPRSDAQPLERRYSANRRAKANG